MSFYIRVWQACDLEQVGRHLMIVGDVTADCAACRELGIPYAEARNCPKCGTDFRFIALRSMGKLDRKGGAVKRVKERRPDLTFIDYDDYREITGKQQARDFFKQ